MKSIARETDKNEYPKLMTANQGVVVLFTSESIGTVVHPGELDYLGDYSDVWDMSVFKEFKGEVVLSNN